MNTKWLADYRGLVASDWVAVLGQYRQSFRFYTEDCPSVANLVPALLCSFFIALLPIRNRIEHVLMFPAIAAVCAVSCALALNPDAVACKPKKLCRSAPALGTVLLTVAMVRAGDLGGYSVA